MSKLPAAKRVKHIHADVKRDAGPDEYLSGTMGPSKPAPWMSVTDSDDVTRDTDDEAVKQGLFDVYGPDYPAGMVKDLVEAIRKARCKLPPINKKPAGIPRSGRQRKPGGGRKPDHEKAILAGDVREVLRAYKFSTSRTHGNGKGEASPYLQIIGVCWSTASGKPRGVDDFRNFTKDKRRWTRMPTEKPDDDQAQG